MKSEPFLRAKDKFSFLVGVLLLMLTEYLFISYPSYLYVAYTIILVPLLMWRFITYHQQKHHYFLLDFCYFANLLTLLWLYKWPHNLALFKVTFALTSGPLLMAVVAWSNSLVFHDIDRITSLFIHLYPPLVFYAERWHGPSPSHFSSLSHSFDTSQLKFSLWIPLVFYILWQAFYFLKTEVLDRSKFKTDKEIVTSVRWLTQIKPHFVYKLLVQHNIHINPNLLLASFQLIYTAFMLSPTLFFYNHQILHQAIILFVFLYACWNGANFYFDIFSLNYRNRLQSQLLQTQAPSSRLPSNYSFFKFMLWFFSFLSTITFFIYYFCK